MLSERLARRRIVLRRGEDAVGIPGKDAEERRFAEDTSEVDTTLVPR